MANRTDKTSEAIINTLGLLDPEKHSTLFAAYGDQGQSAFQMLNYMGRVSGASQTSFSHFELQRFHSYLSIDADVTDPGAGNALVFVVDAQYVTNGNVYVQPGDTIWLRDTPGVKLRVSTVAGTTVTAVPLKAAQAAGAVTAGDIVIIGSSSHAEGSGQPDAKTTETTEITYQMQIIKTTSAVTGTAQALSTYLGDYELTGEGINGYADVDTIAAEYRHYLQIDEALLTGVASDNIADVRHSSGLITEMDARSFDLPTDDFVLANFQSMDRYLTTQHSGKRIGIFASNTRKQEIRENLDTYFKDTNIERAAATAEKAIFGADKMDAMRASINFTYFTNGNFTFCLSEYEGLDNERVYNQGDVTTNDFQGYAMALPMENFRDSDNALSSHLGMRYLEGNGVSRKMKIWEGGANAKVPTNDVDERAVWCLSELGGQFKKLNQGVFIKRAS